MPTPKEGWGGGEGEIVGDAAEMWARCAELGSRCAEIGARSHLRAERRRPLPGLRLPSPPLLSLLQQQRQKRALHALANPRVGSRLRDAWAGAWAGAWGDGCGYDESCCGWVWL